MSQEELANHTVTRVCHPARVVQHHHPCSTVTYLSLPTSWKEHGIPIEYYNKMALKAVWLWPNSEVLGSQSFPEIYRHIMTHPPQSPSTFTNLFSVEGNNSTWVGYFCVIVRHIYCIVALSLFRPISLYQHFYSFSEGLNELPKMKRKLNKTPDCTAPCKMSRSTSHLLIKTSRIYVT